MEGPVRPPPFVSDCDYCTPPIQTHWDQELAALVLNFHEGQTPAEGRTRALTDFMNRYLAASTTTTPRSRGDSSIFLPTENPPTAGGGNAGGGGGEGNPSPNTTTNDSSPSASPISASPPISPPNSADNRRTATARKISASHAVSSLQQPIVFSGRILDVCVQCNDAVTLPLLLSSYHRRFNFSFCGPVRVAVDLDNATLLWEVLQHPNVPGFDFNVGAPLRAAVVQGRSLEMISLLLEEPSINPNKGCPLFYAAERGDVAIVRAIADHHETSVNRFTSAHGTTPLCAAIRAGHDDVVASLLSHPRIDVNKGYFSTPLQLAVATGHVGIVRLLLSRASIQVSKVIAGPHPSPLEIAVREKNDNIVEMLLDDPRTEVEEDLIDYLEMTNDLEVLQLLVASDKLHVKTGKVWNLRFGFCLAAVALSGVEVILDIHLVYAVYAHGLLMSAFGIFAAHTLGTVAATVYLLRHASDVYLFFRLIPLFPVLEIYTLIYMFYYSSTATPSLQRRQELYVVFRRSFVLRAVLTCVPLTTVLLGICALEGVDRDLTGNILLCFLLYAAVCIVGFKIHHLPAPQGVAVTGRELV